MNWILWVGPEPPAVVLTASGKVHIHEEAQVFVHDQNLFVTVQWRDETPAVLSLGKLCEDHGYSCEWVSGQKPRLTKEGKTIICKTNIFVLLVVPGLSTISESSSSSASLSQDSLRSEAERASRQLVPPASSSSSCSVSERSDELATRTLVPFPEIQNQNKKRGDRQFSRIRSGISCDSGNEIEEAQYFYSLPKRPTLRFLLETQNDTGSLQKTHWRSSTSSRKVWWLDNGRITKSSMRDVNQETITSTLSWYRIQPLKDSILSVQNKTSQETERSLRKFLKPSEKPKVVDTDISSEFWQHLWRVILVSLYVNNPSIRDEWHCWKSSAQNKRRDVCCIVAIMLGWKVVVRFHGMLFSFCEIFKTSGEMGKHRMKDGLENRSKGHFPISAKDQSKLHQFGNKVLPGLFIHRICIGCGVKSGREIFWLQTSRIWENWTRQISTLEDSMQSKKLLPMQEKNAHSHRRQHGKIAWNHEFRESTPVSARTWWVSTSRNKKGSRSPQRLLVDRRRLHLSSSCWTSSSTLRAEGRNIPCSTERYCRY